MLLQIWGQGNCAREVIRGVRGRSAEFRITSDMVGSYPPCPAHKAQLKQYDEIRGLCNQLCFLASLTYWGRSAGPCNSPPYAERLCDPPKHATIDAICISAPIFDVITCLYIGTRLLEFVYVNIAFILDSFTHLPLGFVDPFVLLDSMALSLYVGANAGSLS